MRFSAYFFRRVSWTVGLVFTSGRRRKEMRITVLGAAGDRVGVSGSAGWPAAEFAAEPVLNSAVKRPIH